jgi:voltage-gated sodium channel
MTMSEAAVQDNIVERAGKWVEGRSAQTFITVLIIINAIILGLDTSPSIVAAIGPYLMALDNAILGVFIIELVLRIAYRRLSFFTDGWSLFDLTVVLIAISPTGPAFTVLRSLRVLRVLRLITVLPRLRMIVQALLSSLPGLGMIALLQALLFYVAAVISTKTFGQEFPQWFGTIGDSLYTLFQIMTLESWSMGIVRPVMEAYPLAWVFFVPFILIATFTMLNLFIAVIVNAMQTLHEGERQEIEQGIQDIADNEAKALLAELSTIRAEIAALRQDIQHAKP